MLLAIPGNYGTEDKILILRAYEIAKKKHAGQTRASGEPYIVHPVLVAEILMDLQVKAEIVAGGLLHDVLEDTDENFRELESEFGFEIAKIVNAVTMTHRMEKIEKHHPEAKRREIHHYFLEAIKDPRSALIKITDRLANMRTIQYISKERQIENAEETIRMYAPLADNLGAKAIAEELDTISMDILTPEDYKASREASRIYQREIEEKGYHKDKLFECVIQTKLGKR